MFEKSFHLSADAKAAKAADTAAKAKEEADRKAEEQKKKQEEEAKKRLESNSLDFGTPPLKRTHLPRTRITLFHPDGASKTNSSNKGIFLAKMPAWRC